MSKHEITLRDLLRATLLDLIVQLDLLGRQTRQPDPRGLLHDTAKNYLQILHGWIEILARGYHVDANSGKIPNSWSNVAFAWKGTPKVKSSRWLPVGTYSVGNAWEAMSVRNFNNVRSLFRARFVWQNAGNEILAVREHRMLYSRAWKYSRCILDVTSEVAQQVITGQQYDTWVELELEKFSVSLHCRK